MTFMRKLLDVLNMDNWGTGKFNDFDDGNETLRGKDVTKYIKCDENTRVFENPDHSITIVRKRNMITSTCITPPPRENEKQFISEDREIEELVNIFYNSNVPIVKDCAQITHLVNKWLTRDVYLMINESVNECFYFCIPDKLQIQYLNIIDSLNNFFRLYELPPEFIINVQNVKFSTTESVNTKSNVPIAPLTKILYDAENNFFKFEFSNEIKTKDGFYRNTEYGFLIYGEDGVLKRAQCTKILPMGAMKARFKGYKTGFDLFDVRYNGIVYYKREK